MTFYQTILIFQLLSSVIVLDSYIWTRKWIGIIITDPDIALCWDFNFYNNTSHFVPSLPLYDKVTAQSRGRIYQTTAGVKVFVFCISRGSMAVRVHDSREEGLRCESDSRHRLNACPLFTQQRIGSRRGKGGRNWPPFLKCQWLRISVLSNRHPPLRTKVYGTIFTLSYVIQGRGNPRACNSFMRTIIFVHVHTWTYPHSKFF